MEGYSVTEAASVLGVPTERVWELLARGVLSGAPEGDTGMRVFLQPRPAPAPPAVEPKGANGNGDPAQRDPEASPFRELLTEFRNLTERYGQALLALGEARGEVASLRSRVDVLEARMDLRLPFGQPTATASPRPVDRPPAPVASPPTPEPAPSAPSEAPRPEPAPRSKEPEPAATAAHDTGADAEGDGDADRAARRRRSRAHFVEEFAEALARAEDPSPAELPGAADAATAFAALQAAISSEADAGMDTSDAGLPRELPIAEPMIETEDETAPETDVAARVEAEREPEPEPAADAGPAAEPEPALTADATTSGGTVADAPVPEIESDGASEPAAVTVTEQEEPVATAQAEQPDEAGVTAEPMPASAAEPIAGESMPESAEESAGQDRWDHDRYTAVIEEPDWWTPDAAGWDDPLPDAAPAVAPETVAATVDEAQVAPPEPNAEREPAPEPAEAEPETAEAEAESEEPEAHADASGAPVADDEQPLEDPTAAPGEAEAAPQPADRAARETGFAASIGLDQPIGDASGEETMLWFGSRPERRGATPSWPSEDPASETEIAGAGAGAGAGASPVEPVGGDVPDGGALSGEDPPKADPTEPTDDDVRGAVPADGGAAASPTPSAAPGATGTRPPPVELPSPASRAYRRLRRIFPN